MASFDLRYEPWIPCYPCGGDDLVLLSLCETLLRAHEMREIVDQSPLVEVSLLRFLLAVLHRVFGPENSRIWGELWADGKGSFDRGRIQASIDSWEGLDLFSDTHPFYQSGSLPSGRNDPALLLDHAEWTYNNALFSHVYASTAKPLSAARVARFLIAFQAFDMHGTTKGSGAEKYAAAGPLQPAAIITVRGETLFQTLMLNLHQYSQVYDIPFNSKHDRLAWERAEEPRALERHPDGHLDWLTWQSRRVRVFRASNACDDLAVSEAFYVKGYQPPPRFWLSQSEVMMAFQRKSKEEAKKAPSADPMRPIRFRPERSLWRDSTALLNYRTDERKRPRIFDWLGDLVADGVLDGRYPLSLVAYGLCGDQAKVLFWRREQLPLPLAYLSDGDLRAVLDKALAHAERVGRALDDAADLLAHWIFVPQPSGDAQGPEKQHSNKSGRGKDIDDLKRELAPGRRYWPALDTAFSAFLVAQAEEQAASGAAGQLPVGDAFREWARAVRQAAVADFRAMIGSQDGTARVLRARVVAERAFYGALKRERDAVGVTVAWEIPSGDA